MSDKKFPPRVFGWVQDNGVPYGISDHNVVWGAQQEWVSIQEHQEIIKTLNNKIEKLNKQYCIIHDECVSKSGKLNIAKDALKVYADISHITGGDHASHLERLSAQARAKLAKETLKAINETSKS